MVRNQISIVLGVISFLLITLFIHSCSIDSRGPGPRACVESRDGWYQCGINEENNLILQCQYNDINDKWEWKEFDDCSTRSPPELCDAYYGLFADDENPGCVASCEYLGKYYAAGTKECADATTLGYCNRATSSWDITNCGLGEVCVKDACVQGCIFNQDGTTHAEGEVWCYEQVPYQCTNEVSSPVSSEPDLGLICNEWGELMCEDLDTGSHYYPGEKRCVDETHYFECQPESGGWWPAGTEPASCEPNQICQTGDCVTICEHEGQILYVGQGSCDDTQYALCQEDGTMDIGTIGCDDTEGTYVTCQAGAPVVGELGCFEEEYTGCLNGVTRTIDLGDFGDMLNKGCFDNTRMVDCSSGSPVFEDCPSGAWCRGYPNHPRLDECITERYVFITSQAINGDFISESQEITGETFSDPLKAADGICQHLSEEPGSVVPQGIYKAWISDSTTNAKNRLIHHIVPYRGVDAVNNKGDPVATFLGSDWDYIIQNGIANPILVDETGKWHNPGHISPLMWTGTNQQGEYVEPSCNDWTYSANDIKGVHGKTTILTDEKWTNYGTPNCAQNRRLYCVQQ